MAEERVQRRLAAILAADVVGYSRLMERDEAGTLTRLKSLRRELFEPKTKEHGGRIFKTTGDGALVEFKSAVDAVASATEIQRALALRDQGASDDQRIELRIGISLGDVMVEGNDLYGNGVNVAARMEGLAEPGGICVSGNVQEHIGNSLDVALEDLGEQTVKNIERPVRCYRVLLRSDDEPKAEAPPLPDKPSIAVLPFDNISGDPEQDYFADGITEDIITELSKISGLFVIARHSAFTYKGKSVTLKQVGAELGVRYVLEGSVRRAGNRLRITGQLIDAGTDHHIWAERYDRGMEDIFAVQDEVAREVAGALAVALRPGEGERLAHVPTRNIEAYDIYMRSRMRAWPPTLENVVAAREAYDRIIEIDPDFAGGHAGASMTYSLAVRFGHSDRPEEDEARALELAERAMALDDQFALSHSALGFALSVSGRYEEAVAAAQRAVDLQPGDTDGYMYLATVLLSAGRGEEAREALLTALRLDPQYVKGPYFNVLGRACFVAGRYEEAVEAYERNRSGGGPIAAPMLSVWVASLGLLGRIDEAREKARELLRYAPGYTISDEHNTWRFNNPADRSRLIDGLRKAGLPEK